MIQITPQMRVLVAVEAVDGRKGIDSLAALCRERLQADPFSGWMFIFRTRSAQAIKILCYDGQGFWLAQRRLSKGRFRWWPAEDALSTLAPDALLTLAPGASRTLEAHQAQLLLAAGNPETAAAPVWRKVS